MALARMLFVGIGSTGKSRISAVILSHVRRYQRHEKVLAGAIHHVFHREHRRAIDRPKLVTGKLYGETSMSTKPRLVRVAQAGNISMKGTSGARTSDASIIAAADVDAATNKPATRKSRKSDRSKSDRYSLQLRVPESVYEAILLLTERAETESFGELVRHSLRAYERALFEYDRIDLADGRQVQLVNAGRAHTDGEPANFECAVHNCDSGLDNVLPFRRDEAEGTAKATRRLNVPLNDSGRSRLKRLAALTGGVTSAEVVRTALCVLSAELDQYDEIVDFGRSRLGSESKNDDSS